jgi:biopolymer transport protein ExbD
MNYKSFIDILFIILLATLVMLTQSVQLGAVDTALTTLGAGGISPVNVDDVQIVLIRQDEVELDGTSWQTCDELGKVIRPDDPVLLVTAEADVSHHRVMHVWSQLRDRDLDVKLGARPRPSSARNQE